MGRFLKRSRLCLYVSVCVCVCVRARRVHVCAQPNPAGSEDALRRDRATRLEQLEAQDSALDVNDIESLLAHKVNLPHSKGSGSVTVESMHISRHGHIGGVQLLLLLLLR